MSRELRGPTPRKDRDVGPQPRAATVRPRAALAGVELSLGDSAIVVRFGERIDPEVLARVRALANHLDAHPLAGVMEITPAFATLCVFYDPQCWSYAELRPEIQRIVAGLNTGGMRSRGKSRFLSATVASSDPIWRWWLTTTTSPQRK